MVDYECMLCKYKTINKKDYGKHIKTKKHITNSSKKQYTHGVHRTNTAPTQQDHTKNLNKFVCEFCNYDFSRIDALTRHGKTCNKKNNEIIKLKSEYEKRENEWKLENKTLNARLRQSEKNTKYVTDENDYHKKMLNEAGGIVKKSVSALTYIMHNYGSAPTIEMLDIDNLEDLEQNNKKLVEDVISAHKHKTLDKYLGDSIITLYKKDKPENQSVWSTDASRLTYLIKELMVNDSSNWIIDKKGTKTREYLIDPLLKHIKSLIISYQKNMSIGTNMAEMEHILEINKHVIKLIVDIDDGIVGNNLLKYMSSHLFFNEKLLK